MAGRRWIGMDSLLYSLKGNVRKGLVKASGCKQLTKVHRIEVSGVILRRKAPSLRDWIHVLLDWLLLPFAD